MTTYVPSCAIALGLFPRFLGAVYLLAFVSLLVQADGLYGSRGILPIRDYVAALREHLGVKGWRRFPSIFWLNSGDSFVTGCAALGVGLSFLLVLGITPLPLLVILWLIYLSFSTMGQEFLSYQWDALLLETGFMTMFLPLATPASPLVCLAYHFFVFRFILSAGVVKLTSRDPNWRNLLALSFHYETQPIPNRVAWYAHQLPQQLQRLSTLGTFFFELIVPFLALGPAPLRLACFCLLLSFQVLIMLTGNYGFFNCLTIVLCVPLLDDRYLGAIGQAPVLSVPAADTAFAAPLIGAVFLLFLLLNVAQLIRLFVRPYWLNRLLVTFGRLWVSNPYGLFAVMTTERYEFEIQGSNDLKGWQVYEFRWKPGDPAIAPRQAAPHQPRLDWQMWFAALNPSFVEPWLESLVRRLLEGSPPVLALFRTVPFREAPPTFIRLVVYRYHFSDLSTKKSSGRWWNRREIGASAPMTLRGRHG
ncbi:MAG: lipase maturation factor family protein [Deltaproteobacteria bacterium]|nr:lipase maturation factor family protein [Deltaproteobacteria bacterium]